jgi:solute carrier family 35 protein F5
MTIPLALLGDIIGYGRVLGLGYWIGAGLVLAGFFGVNGAVLNERSHEVIVEQEDDGAGIGSASSSSSPQPVVADETQPLLRSRS